MAEVPAGLAASLGDRYGLVPAATNSPVLLGQGGMATVWRIRDLRHDRDVALKVLRPELAAALGRERFLSEIRVTARLDHPHILTLIDSGEHDGVLWYVVPLVRGESLRERITRERQLTLDDALRIFRQVAGALDHAHRQGIVHRDVKPENILLQDGEAILADFGIALAITGADRTRITETGLSLGTPQYMSPEQAAGDRQVDARSDIYALGAVLYEMLAGEPPITGTNMQAVIAKLMTTDPTPLRVVRSAIPEPVDAAVRRALAKVPADRFPDMASFVRAVDAAPGTPPAPRTPARPRLRPLHLALLVVALLVAGAAFRLFHGLQRREWARTEALPEVARLRDVDRPLAAMLLLRQAAEVLPGDSAVAAAVAAGTREVSVTSTPAGATVAIQDYATPDSAWLTLGATPLPHATVPSGYFRWKLSAPGVEEAVLAPMTRKAMHFALDSLAASPTGMVRVPQSTWADFIAFVGWVGPFALPAYYLDRVEVTNREYQVFVDSGGYARAQYWTEPFVRDGQSVSSAEAMALLRDRTGRPGPSTWEGGHYATGQADFPVSGVSWYEAAAYAAWAGKALPTFAQWYVAAPQDIAKFVVQASNISRTALAPAGTFTGLGPYGTLDMAGNVREWVANPVDGNRRILLGGAWNSPSYLYADPEALTSFDRSPANGFRCVRNIAPVPANAAAAVHPLDRDFTKVRPAPDDVFRAYALLYAYADTPLNAKEDGVVADTPDYLEEKVSFDAGYGGQRMSAYLFLPKRAKPPYQTVVFFPSARVLDLTDSRRLGDVDFFDYVVQSGRAVLYPIYQETYERRLGSELPGASQQLTLTIMRSKDLGRSLDYLASRPDIAKDQIAYLGVSMGSAEGVIYATLAQDRLKAVIFLDGGYFLDRPPAGGDQADFAPRLKLPLLMVNGRYDFSFSLERAQEPLFRMVGTPAADKKHVLLETPHNVLADRPALVREVLAWLDRYLGRVE